MFIFSINFDNYMEIKFKKVHTMKDLIVSTIMVAAGAACFLLGEGWGGLGIVIIMCGAMMLPFYHHGYRLESFASDKQ